MTEAEDTIGKGQRSGLGRGLISYAELQILLAIVVLSLIYAVMFPDSFATSGTMLNMARVAGILLVVAIAQSFALIVGGFDISVSATMGLTSVVAATLMVSDVAIGWAILAGILTGAAVGLVNGIGIAVFRVTPFVMTLGMLTAGRGLADLIANGGTIVGLPRTFAMFGRNAWYGVPSAACIALIVMVLAWFVLQRTRAGLYIYSIGGSLETARVAGVPIVRYQILAYAICGALAAVAGLMLTSRVSVSQGSLGQGYELLSVATAVIGGVLIGGGVGRLFGVVLGVALITVLTTGLDIAGVNPFVQQMVTGSVLVFAVIISNLRSGRVGLFGRISRKSGG
jgi:ribose/xylose/arabinose/galactoside ABC-type transport system permease subunit